MADLSKVKAALEHVRAFHPQVTHVFYNHEGLWYYCDDAFDAPEDWRVVDIGLLEDASSSLESVPAAFCIGDL